MLLEVIRTPGSTALGSLESMFSPGANALQTLSDAIDVARAGKARVPKLTPLEAARARFDCPSEQR